MNRPMKVRPAPRLEMVNREQLILRPVNIEQLVPEDHEVRAIWELVERLDLSYYYDEIKAVEGVAGRESIDPQLLISLWIYSYSKGISSSREITRLCEYHPGYQWLTGMRPINYHTLSDFRVKHKECLDRLFVNILGLLSKEGLISLEKVMHDGTKIKACAGSDSFRREETLKKHLKMAKDHLAGMGDPETAEEVSLRVAAAQKRSAKEKMERLERALDELKKIQESKSSTEAKSEVRVSESDPECRIMKQNNCGYGPNYNVQISTDAEAGIIVGVRTTQAAADYNELIPAVERIENNFGKKPEQMVADGGFTSRENIIEMDKQGVDYIGSMGNGTAQSIGQLNRQSIDSSFLQDAFIYDEVTNIYMCPNNKKLSYDGKKNLIGCTSYRYRANFADCQMCPFKEKCCPKNTDRGRSITRRVEDPVVKKFIEKMQTERAKNIYKGRGGIAEFPNAWIKSKIKLRQFCLKGLTKITTESMWACLTYNVQQWIRLRWKVQYVTN